MSTDHLGTVVSSEMTVKGISENAASLQTGISRQTLRRRLASGEFTVPELDKVARLLGVPASELMRRAEEPAA